MSRRHLYSNGYVVRYKEGDISQQRDKIRYTEDTSDRLYTIKEGDNLTYIAYAFYGDPLKWYLIADVNDIDNPFLLEVGKNIIIPGIEKFRI